MASNLMAILNEIASVKQLDKEQVARMIEDSLYQAISKNLAPENELEIQADFVKSTLTARFKRTVVEQDFNFGEISLEEARKRNPGIELGDQIVVKMQISDFEPKVIKNARKAIQESIKKLEEERILFDYEKQKDKLVSGRIRKVDYNGYIVDIGYADALCPLEEQIEDEYYKPGDIIKGYIINIRKRKQDVVVIISRSHPEFVKKLFEAEIPEIGNGDVEIKKIVREPGIRSKVAVSANNKMVDAAGCCLGPKGIRIENIRKELHGEQIDIVVWEGSNEHLISNAIGQDLVEKVYLADRGNFARVIVTAENKNLAIGKKGKNVKLAAKLTGFKLDIYTQEEFEEKISEERRVTSHITDLDGVSAKVADVLRDHGYTSVQDIYEASEEELVNLEGVGKKTAQKIKESAKHF